MYVGLSFKCRLYTQASISLLITPVIQRTSESLSVVVFLHVMTLLRLLLIAESRPTLDVVHLIRHSGWWHVVRPLWQPRSVGMILSSMKYYGPLCQYSLIDLEKQLDGFVARETFVIYC